MKNKRSIIIIFALLFIGGLFVFLLTRSADTPTHLFAEGISSNEIELAWEGEESASQYNIYRKKEGGESYVKIGFSRESKYIDSGLDPNTNYLYKVSQVVDFKESPKSYSVRATTKIGPPTGLKGESVDFQKYLQLRVRLVWDYVIGADEYIVYRTQDEGGIYEEVGRVTHEEYIDKDLEPEATYYYRLKQKDGNYESDYSEEIKISTGKTWECGNSIFYGEKEYKTVLIGEQCWFEENLNIEESDISRDCKIERHCYDNDIMLCNQYGGLYDYESISCGQDDEGAQGICPLGWRIPADSDWVKLETELGMSLLEANQYGFRGSNEGSSIAGRYDLWRNGFLKQDSAFSSSELNILPGGYQPPFNLRLFYELGERTVLWSSTRANEDENCSIWEPAYAIRALSYNETGVEKQCHSEIGTAYVRCMRSY